MAKQLFIDYFREQTGGEAVSGTEYKKIRSEWRKMSGYKSSATRVIEVGQKLAKRIRTGKWRTSSTGKVKI